MDSGSNPYEGERVRFPSRVSAIGDGWIELERPLMYDLRMEWQAGDAWGEAGVGWLRPGAARPPDDSSTRSKCPPPLCPLPPCPPPQAPQPAVYSFANPLQHSGFEDFTIQFKFGERGG